MIQVAIDKKRYGANTVLNNVHFQLDRGETLAVTGPSGVGKTTLLRILAGLDQDFEGSVNCPREIAMVFQEPTLLPWRTASRNIAIPARITDAEVAQALADVGLADKADNYPDQLSLGQQRRLSLARAFAIRPQLLLLDEPFVSLDPALAEEMIGLTERLLAQHKTPAVFVTHSPAEAKRLANKTLILTNPEANSATPR